MAERRSDATRAAILLAARERFALLPAVAAAAPDPPTRRAVPG